MNRAARRAARYTKRGRAEAEAIARDVRAGNAEHQRSQHPTPGNPPRESMNYAEAAQRERTVTFDLDCLPYVPPTAGQGTILELAARASHAANRYRAIVDSRGDFTVTLRAAGALARATDDLAAAIADAVACGNNSLS